MSKKYDIQYTNKFKKQYSKMKKQEHFKKSEFQKVIEILSNNQLLPPKYRNHLLEPKSNRRMGMPCSARYTIRISKIWRWVNINAFNDRHTFKFILNLNFN